MKINKIILLVLLLSTMNGYTKDPQFTKIHLKDSTEYQHADRYIFAPSAFGLDKGDFRYSTYFFVTHEIQYGFTNYLSMGIGTSIIGNPAYGMVSFHHKLNSKSAIMAGDLFLTPTYTDVFAFAGNLLYGMYTYGSENKNISLGAGAWTTLNNEETYSRTSTAITISGILRTSPKWYLISENYAFEITKKESAILFDDLNVRLSEEYFESKNLYIGGLIGFRLIPVKKPQVNWQFGLAYILSFFDDIPVKYDEPNWRIVNKDEGSAIVMSPFFSYSLKF